MGQHEEQSGRDLQNYEAMQVYRPDASPIDENCQKFVSFLDLQQHCLISCGVRRSSYNLSKCNRVVHLLLFLDLALSIFID
jgi:hypothetical protein